MSQPFLHSRPDLGEAEHQPGKYQIIFHDGDDEDENMIIFDDDENMINFHEDDDENMIIFIFDDDENMIKMIKIL